MTRFRYAVIGGAVRWRFMLRTLYYSACEQTLRLRWRGWTARGGGNAR